MKTNYKATWGKSLVVLSILGTLLCIFVAVYAYGWRHSLWQTLVPVLLISGTVPFTILGYSVDDRYLGIRRLFWTTRINLEGFESVAIVPDAMKGSIRACGNGGLFSFTGWYRNKALGVYRAFVTDRKNTVVVKIGKKTYVLSPSPAAGFEEALNRRKPADE